MPAGANRVVELGGRDALAFNRPAVDEQVRVWRQGNAQTLLRREITIERYGQADRCLTDKRFPATDASDPEMIDLFAISVPQADPGQGERPLAAPLADLSCPDEILQLARATPAQAPVDRQLLEGDELGNWEGSSLLLEPAVERPSFGEELSGLDWLFVLTAILIIAFRMGLGRILNQVIFLWTPRGEGVTVDSRRAHRRGRRRRSTRKSRWSWQSTRGSSAWSLRPRPSRGTCSRRRRHSRKRWTSRSRANSSARPSYRRGGREYVVADVVFTANGPIARGVAVPQRGLLTSAIR